MKELVIIPDVHGRPFWKEPVQEALSRRNHVIFLGDYLDPYGGEGISQADAFERFEEILELKKEHTEFITLLLGNHDLHYLSPDLAGGRKDYLRAGRIKALLQENAGSFRIAETFHLGDKDFLCSHAGILGGWLASHPELFEGQNGHAVVATLNELWLSETRRPELYRLLADIPYSRWGRARFGSPVWSDVDDVRRDTEEILGYYQIFGHSQQENAPVITEFFACLDCRRAFKLTEEGVIEEYVVGKNGETALHDRLTAAFLRLLHERDWPPETKDEAAEAFGAVLASLEAAPKILARTEIFWRTEDGEEDIVVSWKNKRQYCAFFFGAEGFFGSYEFCNARGKLVASGAGGDDSYDCGLLIHDFTIALLKHFDVRLAK